MRFYADENVDYPVIQRLRTHGHEVKAVSETEPALADEEVLERANAAEAILITIDKDFGELVYRSSLSSKGVILLRLETLPSHAKAAVLAAVVEQHGAELLEGVWEFISLLNKGGLRGEMLL